MNHRSGFVMLITLTVLGLVTAMMLNVWFIASFQRDVVDERERWYKNFYMTRDALDSVIEKIKKNAVTRPLSSQAGPWDPFTIPTVLDMTTSKLKQEGSKLVVSIQQPKKGSGNDMLVNAMMRQGDVTLCTLRCLMTKKVIQTAKGGKIQCEVRGFTVA